MDVTVLGTGDAARALGARARARGHVTRLWGRPGPRLEALRLGDLLPVEPDLDTAVRRCDTVVVAVTSTAQGEVVGACADALRDDHVVFLVPGHTGGLWGARSALAGTSCRPTLAETYLPFICRSGPNGDPQVLQDKNEAPIAVWPPDRASDAVRRAQALGWRIGELATPLSSALQNMTVVFQPALMICNATRIEAGEHFRIYRDGVTPAVGRLWAALDRERLALAAALGVRVPSAQEWLRRAYGARGDDLVTLMSSVEGYRDIRAPRMLDHRFLREHVEAGLVPMTGLAHAAGVPTPVMDGVVATASALLGVDLRAGGRDLTAYLPTHLQEEPNP